MVCRTCGTDVDRPGDYCLACHTQNTDAVVVEFRQEAATLWMLWEETIRGETTVTTTLETGEFQRRERRNFLGRIADEIRRKRPDSVYVMGDRDLGRRLRTQIRYDVRRVEAETDPVEAVLENRGEAPTTVVETPPLEKITGAHSTVIGDRAGRRVLKTVADRPNVKKVVPGPIDASGESGGGGVRAKATRVDGNGNVRLLVRDGSAVQQIRVITTAGDRGTGESIQAAVNDAFADAGFRR